jgi:hypothetical protein
VPEVEVPDVRVMTVPDATLEDAVTEQVPAVDPDVAAVLQLMMAGESAVHVSEAVDGVTGNRLQVVADPEKEKIVMLGLQAAGATAVTSAFRVAC